GRQIEGIRDVRNLSAGLETKLVIYLKRDDSANVVLNNLYKHTPLQTSFGVNMVALVDGVPRTLDLKQAIQAYVDHQVEVIRRRSEYRLKKAQDRAHIVEGLLSALGKIDRIIVLIRGSADRDGARRALMAKPFNFSDIQANHILDMRLVMLTRLNGYVKSVAADAFRTQGRGGRGVQAAKLRDNDYVAHLLTTTAHSYLLFFSNRGKVYRLKAHEIPMKERTARGTAIVNLLPLTPD